MFNDISYDRVGGPLSDNNGKKGRAAGGKKQKIGVHFRELIHSDIP